VRVTEELKVCDLTLYFFHYIQILDLPSVQDLDGHFCASQDMLTVWAEKILNETIEHA
jgi:hypothetical protein